MFMNRIVLALTAPLLLVGCLLQPGKFTSDLTINADRTFSFSYKGEVIAVDPSESMGSSLGGLSDDSASSSDDEGDEHLSPDDQAEKAREKAAEKVEKAKKAAEQEVKRKAIATALSKEAGYRSVQYLGKGKYLIDYAISGKLDHNFIYPFNSDAEIIFPFIALELRKDGNVRMMAPAFTGSQAQTSGTGMPSKNDALDGVFTLTTNAEIVMHNNEDGVKPAGANKTLAWRLTPLTKDAPTAVLKMK